MNDFQPSDESSLESQVNNEEQTALFEALGNFVRHRVSGERQLLSTHKFLFTPSNIRLGPENNIPSGIIESEQFRSAFDELFSWQDNPQRELRIECESILSPGTKFLVLSTPKSFSQGIWKNQSFSIIGTDFGFSQQENNGRTSLTQQGFLTESVRKKLWRAFINGYSDKNENIDTSDSERNKLMRTSQNKRQFVTTLFKNSGFRFENVIGENVLVPGRLMTDDEMSAWMKNLKSMSTTPTRVHFARVSRGFSLDYGMYLVDQWTDQDGNPTFNPYITVPVNLNADGKSAWMTATLKFDGDNLAAVHLNHGNKHIPQMTRSLNPGNLF